MVQHDGNLWEKTALSDARMGDTALLRRNRANWRNDVAQN
jgi:hypothetical protein